VEQLIAALEPDDIVLGGGNVKLLKKLPKGCRAGDNANAFLGGFRLWKEDSAPASNGPGTAVYPGPAYEAELAQYQHELEHTL
jgi:polyphosphate glucokinase